MNFKEFYLQANCFWRSDYDAILLTNQTSTLRLNQKAGVIFLNYILKKNFDITFFVENNISEEEVDNLISLLEDDGLISEVPVENQNMKSLPHISK